MPPRARPIQVSLIREGQLRGRFSLLIVTTLAKLLLGGRAGAADKTGSMKLMAVDQSLPALIRRLFASMSGQLGKHTLSGIHLERGDMLRIEGDHGSVILEGEFVQADDGRPLVLTSTQPGPILG